MSKRKLTYEDFKKYFFNRQKSDEKRQFEKEMMQDAFEEEAFDGLSMLTEEEFEKDITTLKNTITKRTKKRTRIIPLYLRYAAGIAILIGIGLTSLYVFDKQLKDDLQFAEPIHETMALTDSAPQKEENKALEEEKLETAIQKEDQKLTKAPEAKPANKKEDVSRTIDDVIITENDREKPEIEFDISEDFTEIAIEEVAESEESEREEHFALAQEKMEQEPKEEAITEKTVETKPATRSKEKSGKRDKRNRRLFKSNKQKKATGEVTPTADEALAGNATVQSQETTIQPDRDIILPNNWIKDTLETNLIKEINKRYNLNGETYKIEMDVTIDINGQISEINYNKDIPEDLRNIISAILKEFGAWQPAVENGQFVRNEVNVKFKLK